MHMPLIEIVNLVYPDRREA